MSRLTITSLLAGGVFLAMLSGCTQIQVTPLDKPSQYALKMHVDDGANSFNNFRLRNAAEDVCPKSFDSLSKNITLQTTIPTEGASCLTGENCLYTLEWRIACVDRPRTPFSIFGQK